MPPYIVSLILLAIVVIAFLAGNYVSRSMRMPETGWKVSLIVGAIGVAVMILITSWPPKQGIDLIGGVILIYEVDESMTRQSTSTDDASADQANAKVDMKGLIQALSERINPGGVQEIVIRAYGDKQVEIIIPKVGSAEVERIKKLITTGGFLKFQIVANRRDHSHIWSLADQPDQVGQYQVRDENGAVVGQWAKLSLTGDSTLDNPVYKVDPPQAKSRSVRGRKEVLMVVDADLDMQGSHLQSVRKGYQDVSPAVFFDTTITGARLMEVLTESNLPDTTSGHYSLLGIVMDGDLISAPRINTRISNRGVIEGQFTDDEVDMLVNVLRAGRLPAVLHPEPISQNEISSLLGSDTIRQGKFAILVSLMAVLVFMLVYYMFAGVVSCVALILNLTFILALMIFVGAAFSLPGMAALVLTVGMSVDANVLIFERIGEEMRHGAALRMSIRNGFGRATRTIVDANVTTLITAVVLYLIGTEQLRAFAVALILGILMTLFTAIFCSRVIFDLCEKVGLLKGLHIRQPLAGVNLNLFDRRGIAAVFSTIMIIIGLSAVGARGRDIFDIDFLGGTSVQMVLNQPMEVAQVRQLVDKMRDDGIVQDVSVTEVKSQDRADGTIYRVDTSLPEAAGAVGSAVGRVQDALTQQFQDDQGQLLLKTHSLTYSPPRTISTGAAAIDLPASAPVDGTSVPADQTDAEIADPSDLDASGATVPDPEDGARTQLPADTLLAWAGDSLLAQADLANPPALPQTTTTTNDPPSATSPGLIDASVLRCESELEFDEPMNAETLEQLIRDTATELNVTQPDVMLSNDQWDGRSSLAYQTWNVKLSTTADQSTELLSALKTRLDTTPAWLAANQIGSSVAGDKTRLAVAAVVGSLFGIIAYIWLRFQHVTYGLAAVTALLHDVLITLGAIAISYWLKDVFGFLMIDEFKISLPVVAAFLTIIGYSLNDTIVVFDRIREVKGKSPKLTADIVNRSINQTLSRTLLTSLTTLLAVLILYSFGGQGIHAFSFALLIGVIVGTYSSIFVASPALLWMSRWGDVAEKQPERVTA